MKILETKQRGIVLLALLLVVVISGSTFTLSALNARQDAAIEEQVILREQLELAKANLLAYTAYRYSTSIGPGFFPCPDMDNDEDGAPDANCDSSNQPVIGRLPQYVDIENGRIPLNSYYADVDRQFWYVVGPRYVFHSTTTNYRQARRRIANTVSPPDTFATNFRLYLDDVSEYVALIIAPGEVLAFQDRADDPSDAGNYLEEPNGSSGFYFYTNEGQNPDEFNDQIIGITLDEYLRYVIMTASKEMKKELDNYYAENDAYPPSQSSFRALFDDHSYLWLRRNATAGNGERWATYTRYTVINDPDAPEVRLTFTGCVDQSPAFDAEGETDLTVVIRPGSEFPVIIGDGC